MLENDLRLDDSPSRHEPFQSSQDDNIQQYSHDQEILLTVTPQRRPPQIAKTISLICSSIAALASGTPYLYGVYSPQLINRCGFSALDSSYLSFSGSIGTSIGGFFAGLIIDKFGIRPGLLLGAILEFTGFGIFYINYKYALHNFLHLLIAMCCIGFGSVLAYFATIKVATINFPKHRGFANACPVSAYGLAALFYAFVSTVFFSDNVEGLLQFIALFTGIVISAASIFIRIYEKEEEDEDDNADESRNAHGLLNDASDSENESSEETEIEAGLKYLLKGHRGSFAEVNNIFRANSSASLFSEISDASSLVSSSVSSSLRRDQSRSSSNNLTMNPISITGKQSGTLRSQSNGALSDVSSSPLDFKTKQSMMRSASFRLGTPSNNSPRNSRLFGSFNPMQNRTGNSCDSTVLTPALEHASTQNQALNASSLSSSPSGNINTPVISKSALKLSSVDEHISPNLPDYQSSRALEIASTTSSTTSLQEFLNNDMMNSVNQNQKKIKRRRKKKLSPKEHVLDLLKNKLFISHYALNAFYCAIGQVYIFGIGFIVRAQVNYYREHRPESLLVKFALYLANSTSTQTNTGNMAVAYQALQVSIISFSNFLGRLISGPASDLIHKKLKMNKIIVIIVSLLMLAAGQILLLMVNKLDFLSLTSFLIGLSYGSIYGTMPSIVADSFGSRNFATTWALLGTGPISVFLILSDFFGTIYDKNSEWGYLDDKKIKMCLKGMDCYRSVFQLTSVICLLLLIGYLWLLAYCRKRQDQK